MMSFEANTRQAIASSILVCCQHIMHITVAYDIIYHLARREVDMTSASYSKVSTQHGDTSTSFAGGGGHQAPSTSTHSICILARGSIRRRRFVVVILYAGAGRRPTLHCLIVVIVIMRANDASSSSSSSHRFVGGGGGAGGMMSLSRMATSLLIFALHHAWRTSSWGFFTHIHLAT